MQLSRTLARRAGVLAALLAAGGALAWAGPPSLASTAGGSAEWKGRSADSQVAALATYAAWLLLAWLVVAALSSAAAGLPGGAGRIGRGLSNRIAPAVVRRAVEAALGLAITASIAAPSAALAVSSAPGRPAVTATSLGIREQSRAQLGDRVFTVAATVGTVDQPPAGFDRPGQAPPVAVPGTQAQARSPESAPIAVVLGARRAEDAPGDQLAVVHRGDSLWSIAARELGPDAGPAAIDARWRRWYAANRSTIGPDPNLIMPGARLVPPAGGRAH